MLIERRSQGAGPWHRPRFRPGGPRLAAGIVVTVVLLTATIASNATLSSQLDTRGVAKGTELVNTSERPSDTTGIVL
jgi:hypothetical protein